jgi:hypothetical protein
MVISLLYGHLSNWSWLGVKILCLVPPFARFMAKEMMILSIIFPKSCPLPKLIPHLPPSRNYVQLWPLGLLPERKDLNMFRSALLQVACSSDKGRVELINA